MMDGLIGALRKLAQRGPRFAAVYLREVAWFDIVNRTDTGARKFNGTGNGEAIYYVASFTSVIRATLNKAREILGESFVDHQFVDVGCGKGKVLLVYGEGAGLVSKYPPLGIEYDTELCETANANLRRAGLDRSGASVHHADALSLLDHVSADRLIVFLYNPFVGGLFHAFIDSIKDIPHLLIYADPVEREYLESRGYQVKAEHRGHYHADTWLVAQWHPA